MLTLHYQPYRLFFRFEAGTSRGVLTERPVFFLHLKDQNGTLGIGEAAPLEKLSIDAVPNYEQVLANFCHKFNRQHYKDHSQTPESFWLELQQSEFAAFPSLIFAMETAMADYKQGGKQVIFDNEFSQGKKNLPINGLVWMGKKEFMLKQIAEKLEQGYTCLKMKVGAIHFEEELAILQTIRKQFSAQQIVLRVDANGAFGTIEQPIKAGQLDQMAALCQQTPLPIALDEELIGIHTKEDKIALLKTLQPQYIVLKPTLIGGFEATTEWIAAAEQQNITWWITSALESNVGLNAICQYTAQKILGTANENFPQGLGTGQLYHNNLATKLYIAKGEIGLQV
jgi:o-succinylbenzoate synthase